MATGFFILDLAMLCVCCIGLALCNERKISCRDGRQPLHIPERKFTTYVQICPEDAELRIEKGYCLVYSEDGGQLTFDSKTSCTSYPGCPDKPYSANEVSKYPVCLEINTKEGCYLADPNCTGIKETNKATKIGDNIIFPVFIFAVSYLSVHLVLRR